VRAAPSDEAPRLVDGANESTRPRLEPIGREARDLARDSINGDLVLAKAVARDIKTASVEDLKWFRAEQKLFFTTRCGNRPPRVMWRHFAFRKRLASRL
jgi:hypothetical protein